MVNRLFEIVYILLDGKKVTAEQLAKRLEVSRRTIYRDIDTLSMAGIPVYMTKGKGGGVRLLDDYVLNKAVLSQEERSSIVSSLQAFQSLGITGVSETLQKLNHLFCQEQEDWIEIDFSNWKREPEVQHTFYMIKEAILQRQKVSFRYIDTKGNWSNRMVRPYKLCFRGQAWYLYGYCEERKAERYFKLLRLSNLSVLEETFTSKPVKAQMKSLPDIKAKEQIQVKLYVKSCMVYRAFDELEKVQLLDNGDAICTIEVEDIDWFYYYVMTYGEYAILLEPDYAVQGLRKKLENMSFNYKSC